MSPLNHRLYSPRPIHQPIQHVHDESARQRNNIIAMVDQGRKPPGWMRKGGQADQDDGGLEVGWEDAFLERRELGQGEGAVAYAGVDETLI